MTQTAEPQPGHRSQVERDVEDAYRRFWTLPGSDKASSLDCAAFINHEIERLWREGSNYYRIQAAADVIFALGEYGYGADTEHEHAFFAAIAGALGAR